MLRQRDGFRARLSYQEFCAYLTGRESLADPHRYVQTSTAVVAATDGSAYDLYDAIRAHIAYYTLGDCSEEGLLSDLNAVAVWMAPAISDNARSAAGTR
jgi:hypothetical protein